METTETSKEFKFGDNPVKVAKKKVKIPIKIGDFETKVEACLVESDIPLLISGKDLKNWQATINYHTDVMTIGKTGDTVKLRKTASGHTALPLGEPEENIKIYASNIGTVKRMKNKTLQEEVTKVHKVLGHSKEERMISFYDNRQALTQEIKKIIKRVCSQCNLCKQFNKSMPRPKVDDVNRG